MSGEVFIRKADVDYLLRSAVDERAFSWGDTDYNCQAAKNKCKCYELVGGIVLYFSYDTLIGFSDAMNKKYVIKNYWRSSTGRHLNFLERDVKKRLLADEFQRRFDEKVVKCSSYV